VPLWLVYGMLLLSCCGITAINYTRLTTAGDHMTFIGLAAVHVAIAVGIFVSRPSISVSAGSYLIWGLSICYPVKGDAGADR
jgi:uncharacterized membrane protein